jgi:hypothetical protein
MAISLAKKHPGTIPKPTTKPNPINSVGYGANDEHRKPERSRPSTHPTIPPTG